MGIGVGVPVKKAPERATTGPSGDAILNEDGSYILLETGDYLLKE